MAPKEWSNESTISEPTLRKVLVGHGRAIERGGWHAMNSEEFCDSFLGLLKELGRHSLKLNKSEVRKSLANAHLRLTPAEMDHFSRKLTDSISYVKRRLRQKGSGKRLPAACRSLAKVHHHKNMTTHKATLMAIKHFQISISCFF